MANLTLVCACSDESVLEANLLTSPCLRDGKYDLTVQRGYANVPRAYNDAARRTEADVLCFVHQDVFLPEGWDGALHAQLRALEERDPDWGLAGCAGVTWRDGAKEWVGHMLDRGHGFGSPDGLPRPVDTLDEVLLACRGEDALFDEFMPSHHLFGAEACLRLADRGRKSYAIDAYCHHNSTQDPQRLGADFALACGYLYGKYAHRLPIAATCVTIQRRNGICSLTV